jgi:hypothetical protein
VCSHTDKLSSRSGIGFGIAVAVPAWWGSWVQLKKGNSTAAVCAGRGPDRKSAAFRRLAHPPPGAFGETLPAPAQVPEETRLWLPGRATLNRNLSARDRPGHLLGGLQQVGQQVEDFVGVERIEQSFRHR